MYCAIEYGYCSHAPATVSVSLLHPEEEGHHVAVYWFAPPRYIVIEYIVSHVLALPILVLLSYVPWTISVPSRPTNGPKYVHRKNIFRDSTLWVLEMACIAFLLVNAIAMPIFKASTNRIWYLFMPCNLSTYVLLYMFCAPRDMLHGKLFNL